MPTLSWPCIRIEEKDTPSQRVGLNYLEGNGCASRLDEGNAVSPRGVREMVTRPERKREKRMAGLPVGSACGAGGRKGVRKCSGETEGEEPFSTSELQMQSPGEKLVVI